MTLHRTAGALVPGLHRNPQQRALLEERVSYIALFLKRRQNLGDGLSPVTKDVRGPHRGPWSDLDVGTGCVVCAVPDLPIDRCTTPADSRGRRQERPEHSRTSVRRDWPSAARGRKKRIAVTVKLHMAGLSSIERYVHAQKEQGKQMGRVGDACGDFSVRRLRAVRVELCSGGEASGRCSGLPRPQKLGHGSSGPQLQALSRTAARMLGGSGIRQRGCGTSLPPKALHASCTRSKKSAI